MTKTARETIATLMTKWTSPKTQNEAKAIERDADQALKELEAIIEDAKPYDGDSLDMVVPDGCEYVEEFYQGVHTAISQYETNLKTALYGKESN